eukprot:TRINITY_DN5187_c0_g4_i1.p1 TRINITY_DN5187_c0_g4~~TRINITY_DN5187_c0_g4_i1.p1  ORF type:complete len:196 (+),score=17.05 TRINITY_DN5187_c0_g4_i1:34-621(+)
MGTSADLLNLPRKKMSEETTKENFGREKNGLRCQYSVLYTKGVEPTRRSSFAVCLLPGNKIFLLGGSGEQDDLHDSYLFSLNDLSWTQLDLKSASPLVGHAAICLARGFNQSKVNVFIFGGWNGKLYSDDSILVNPNTLKTLVWKANFIPSPSRDSRLKQLDLVTSSEGWKLLGASKLDLRTIPSAMIQLIMLFF